MSTEIDKIIEHSYEFAKELLTETGELYPFGAYIGPEGNVHPLEFEYDKKNMPTVGKVLEALTTYCTDEMKKGKMPAYGLTFQASVQLEKDKDFVNTFAIDITTGDKKQPPVYYYPYSIKENKEVVFGDPFAVKRSS